VRVSFWHIAGILILLLAGSKKPSYAQPKTEQAQLSLLLGSMQSQNSNVHTRLFPSFDTLLMLVETHNPQSEVAKLHEDPARLQKFDPRFNAAIVQDYDYVIKKGKDLGLHWPEIILTGYELHKTPLTRDLEGLDKIMPMRFHGLIFVEDMLTRRRYGIAVKDMESIRGEWFGGQLINIAEAKNADEYEARLVLERKKLLHPELFTDTADTVVVDAVATVEEQEVQGFLQMSEYEEDEDDKNKKPRKEVAERLYFTGMFDNNIPVEMYIRGLKGNCPEPSCHWEAMYKYRDYDEFIKLLVERTPEGKWIFTEQPDVGAMELELKDGNFTGVWVSLKDKTEYEVRFEEKKEVRSRKLFKLDDIIENELYAQ